MTERPHPQTAGGSELDATRMRTALAAARRVRGTTSPNPWVGSVLVATDGTTFVGATSPPGGAHAEVVALRSAGTRARGATLYVTLEPCSHYGRTPPCVDAIVKAGISRVVVGVVDPDPHVAGAGIRHLREAGADVDVGVLADEIATELAPYLTHRTTGLPYVILKLAATLDGRIAAPDRTSSWITGEPARIDVHRLRAESDAILVGAGTVRSDDPLLTVRAVPGRDPLRVVLGHIPPGARVLPAIEEQGELPDVLRRLADRGVMQLVVEGGARVAHAFHSQGLVDRYVLYLAPALFGGDDALGMFAGDGAASMAALWRGRLLDVARLGADLRVDLVPAPRDT